MREARWQNRDAKANKGRADGLVEQVSPGRVVDQRSYWRNPLLSRMLFLEGGGSGPDSKSLQARCREGFRTLLENCGFTGRMPRLAACGGRASAFDDFKTAHKNKAAGDYVAML